MGKKIKFDPDHMIISVDEFNNISLTATSEYLIGNFGTDDPNEDTSKLLFDLIPNKEQYTNYFICSVDEEF